METFKLKHECQGGSDMNFEFPRNEHSQPQYQLGQKGQGKKDNQNAQVR